MPTNASFFENWKWLFSESLKLLTSPLNLAASVLDAARGWRYSRRWLVFFLSLPGFALLVLVYLAFGFSLFERTDTRVQRYGVKSEKVCSTQLLEEVAYGKFDFLRESMLSEDSNAGANSSLVFQPEKTQKTLTDLQIRYIRLLNERILLTQPTDGSARYRLALLKAILGDRDDALDEMRLLANDPAKPFPASNSWVVTELIDRMQKSPSPSIQAELIANLKPASVWPGVKARVLGYYAELLFAKNMTADAISIANEAAKKDRSFHLLLMQYYSRMGNMDGVKTSGYEVEAYFRPRLNTAIEKVSDRLALVEAAFLVDKPDIALGIVEEGIQKASGADKSLLSRTYSNIKIRLFTQSIQKQEDGRLVADMPLLEEAAMVDPDNPLIAEQVANLLQKQIRPSRDVIAILKRQIDMGITTASTHRILAMGYYESGNIAEAIKNFEYAVEKSNVDANSRNDLAMLLAREENPDLDRSVRLIEEAISMNPNNPFYLDTYGQVLIIAENYVEAIPKLEKSLELAGRFEDAGLMKSQINTRKQLSKAYRKLEMNDMADAQDSIIAKLEEIAVRREQEEVKKVAPNK